MNPLSKIPKTLKYQKKNFQMSIQNGVIMKADDLILTVIKKSGADQVRDHFHLELETKRDHIKSAIEKKFRKNIKSGTGIHNQEICIVRHLFMKFQISHKRSGDDQLDSCSNR